MIAKAKVGRDERRETLGRYQLVSRIGSGGAAEVWLGRFETEARVTKYVAIKRLLPQVRGRKDAEARLIHEAELGVLCEHPNIVSVLDVGRKDGEPFIVFEHLRGVSLAMLLHTSYQQGLRVPAVVAASLMLQLCDALTHLHGLYSPEGHALNVVHCDVAPQNVVITESGQVKLIDLGIACSTAWHGNVVEGHPGYIAPERMQGLAFDQRADIWALGALLRELLRVSAGASDPSVESSRRFRFAEALGSEGRLRRKLAKIASRSFEEQPVRRYPSAAALSAALRSMFSGEHPPLGQAVVAAWLQELSADELSRQRILLGHRGSRRLRLSMARLRSAAPDLAFVADDEAPVLNWGDQSGVVGRLPWSLQLGKLRRAPFTVFLVPMAIKSALDRVGKSLKRGARFVAQRLVAARTGEREWQASDPGAELPGAYTTKHGVSLKKYSVVLAVLLIALQVGCIVALLQTQPAEVNAHTVATASLEVTPTTLVMPEVDAPTAESLGQQHTGIHSEAELLPLPPPSTASAPATAPGATLVEIPEKVIEGASRQPEGASRQPPAAQASVNRLKQQRYSPPATRASTGEGSKRPSTARRTLEAPATPNTMHASSANKSPRKAAARVAASKALAPVTAAPGFLTVDAAPYGHVYIDGKSYGATPVVDIPLKPGAHYVVAKGTEGRERHLRIQIESGKGKGVRVRW